MIVKSFPWDSVVKGFDAETGFPEYDRTYTAEDFRNVIMRFFSDGIFTDDTNAFQCSVQGNSSMKVTVAPGTALIRGTTVIDEMNHTFNIANNTTTMSRYDSLVLRWNASVDSRNVELMLKSGVPSATPTPPSLTRNELIWELGLFDILVRPNQTLTSSNIRDTRLDPERCGIVTPYAEFDTTSFYNIITDASKEVQDKASELLVELMNFRDSAELTINGKADQFIEEANKATEEMKAKANETLNKANSDISEMKSELQSQTDKAVELSKAALDGTMATHLQNQIDYINDETTGINLLRGTKDFRAGSKKSETLTGLSAYVDGFLAVSDSGKSIDEHGFTVYTIKRSGTPVTSTGDIQTSIIENVDFGDTYTIAFDVKFDDVDAINDVNASFGAIRTLTASSVVKSVSFTLAANNIKQFEENKWYPIRQTISITSETEKALNAYIRLTGNGNLSVRNICVYKGNVNNPIWSPSPFDINDETNGINLLKTTRDALEGSTLTNTGNTVLYSDGFRNLTDDMVTRKDGEYSVITRKSTDSATNVYTSAVTDISGLTKTFTGSFEFMLDDLYEVTDFEVARLCYYRGNSSINATSVPYRDLKGIAKEAGKWYKCVFRYSLPSEWVDGLSFVFITLIRPSVPIHFRKLMIQEGNINNPIWSPSPFDVAQENEIVHKSGDTMTGDLAIESDTPHVILKEADTGLSFSARADNKNLILGYSHYLGDGGGAGNMAEFTPEDRRVDIYGRLYIQTVYVPPVRYGTANVKLDSSTGSGSQQVTILTTPFAELPIVVATPVSEDDVTFAVNVTENNKFTIYASGTAGKTVTFNWIATGQGR